jgi:putative SOS response-associated peptidase YedK
MSRSSSRGSLAELLPAWKARPAQMHDRVPSLPPREAERIWLDPAVQHMATLMALPRPYPPENPEAYRVSTPVHSTRADDAALLERKAGLTQ